MSICEVTVVPVTYRDASNYKTHRDFRFRGVISTPQRAALAAALEDGEFFIPTQVGLPHLGASGLVAFPSEDDHVFHELDLDEITVTAGTANDTITEFVDRMTAANRDGWDVTAAMQALDLDKTVV